MLESMTWEFPLPRNHTGILLGNATMGIMVWGEGQTLRVTVGRADLWDHRGGMPWQEQHNYNAIRACLEAKDEAGIRALFQRKDKAEGVPRRPSVLPLGRIDIDLGSGAMLTSGVLDLTTGQVQIEYEHEGESRSLELFQCMESHLLVIDGLDRDDLTITPLPSWEFKGDYFEGVGMVPPVRTDSPDLIGWAQDLPEDPAVAVLCKRTGSQLFLCTTRGESEDAATFAAEGMLENAVTLGRATFEAENEAWWKAYWESVADVTTPNSSLNKLYAYGLYKLACYSQPDGVAGTLQGPWIEEDGLPPWSSDYHFNINVQMCYAPLYKANRTQHLLPLFDLIKSWEPLLQQNAKHFIGIDDGFLLPHAVDDRGTCMGEFWTGCIDHACTAWVANMMFDYTQYACDADFLSERALPFMHGAMRVYEAMLERDGDSFRLPVSVSPEYRGAAMNAWGANASFQLACMRRLCENLLAATQQLEIEPDPAWSEILERLPLATLTEDGKRIALWEGVDLEESHRHHSHLAGITPFDTIELDDPNWRPILENSIMHWVGIGMGRWSGWCVPWASMIHSRFGNGEMAELLLEIWQRVFTNEGGGTLHDAHFAGFTMLMSGGLSRDGGWPRERMQLDAGMGAVWAIQEMLLHSRRGIVHVFSGVPEGWKDCHFEGMLVEGGFLVSAKREAGKTVRVQIEAQHDGTIRIACPWTNNELSMTMKAGEVRVLQEESSRTD